MISSSLLPIVVYRIGRLRSNLIASVDQARPSPFHILLGINLAVLVQLIGFDRQDERLSNTSIRSILIHNLSTIVLKSLKRLDLSLTVSLRGVEEFFGAVDVLEEKIGVEVRLAFKVRCSGNTVLLGGFINLEDSFQLRLL